MPGDRTTNRETASHALAFSYFRVLVFPYTLHLRRIIPIRPRAAPNSIMVDPLSGTLLAGSFPLKRVRLEKPPNPFDPVPLAEKVNALAPLR